MNGCIATELIDLAAAPLGLVLNRITGQNNIVKVTTKR